MYGNIACIAAVLLGVDAGWQPLPEGGVEYIIQIEPELLETLKSGEPIQSDVPSYVKDVRAYRITVGTGKVPRELPPKEAPSPDQAAARADRPPSDPFLPPPRAPSFWPDLSGEVPSLRQPGAESPTAPELIEPAPDSRPIDVRPTGYHERPAPGPKPELPQGPSVGPESESKSPSEQEPRREESRQDTTERAWTPLIVALFTLFGSLGANLYLGWITWNTRSRYRALIEGIGEPELE